MPKNTAGIIGSCRGAIGVTLIVALWLAAGRADAVPAEAPKVNTAPDSASPVPAVFMRFTILTPEAPPVKAIVRSKWYWMPWTGAVAPDIRGTDGKLVPPGTASAWGDIAPSFNKVHKGPAAIQLILQGEGNKPMPAHWKARVEFAHAPDADAVIKTAEEEWDGASLVYIVRADDVFTARATDLKSPPLESLHDLDADPKIPCIESLHDLSARHLAYAESLDLPGGKGDFRPKYFHIEGAARGWSQDQAAAEMTVLEKLGFNGLMLHTTYPTERDLGAAELRWAKNALLAAGLDPARSWRMHYMQVKCSFDPAVKAQIEKQYLSEAEATRQADPGVFANIGHVYVSDEPRMLNDLRHIPGCSFCQAAFREWLQKRGVTPQLVGCKTWDEVKPMAWDDETGAAPVRTGSVETRRLGWYSHLFSVETAGLPFKYATDAIQKGFGRPVQTSINPSDGAVVCQDMTINGNGWSFPALGRLGATTIPWTEDWPMGNPHLTPFLVDLLRSSGPAQHIPLGMYIIYGWVPSKEPHFAELKTISAAARGVKWINHYLYGPRCSMGANTFANDPVYLKGVAYVNRVLGLSDDVLGPAMPPDRKVAILWSTATDQWRNKWIPAKGGTFNREADGTFGIERRMLHFALTMQQIPVDFIDEVDVPSRLKEYKVLFVPGSHLVAECVPVMQDWVKAGGTLIIGNGGPDRDEVNEPLTGFLALTGLSGVERRQDDIKYTMEQNVSAKPTTEVTLNSAQAPIGVAGFKAVLSPAAGTKVLGSYKEGGAAVVEHGFGQGRVITFGFNPGIALLMKMDPAVLAKKAVFWDVFPSAELSMIANPVLEAGALPPVSTQIGVDAARLDGPNGSAVTLANYTLSPIEKLPVLVRGLTKVSKVVSVVRGPLAFKQTSEGITFELPLESVDVIKCYE